MRVLKVCDVDVLLDDWDWLRLCRYRWRIVDNGLGHKCIARDQRIKGKHLKIYMHRDIMKTPEGMECHHKDGNTYNNQSANLVNLTKGEHMRIEREKT